MIIIGGAGRCSCGSGQIEQMPIVLRFVDTDLQVREELIMALLLVLKE